jgi:imidazolonepropionase
VRVLRGIGRLAACRRGGGQGELHAVDEAALAWEDGRIAWAGAEADLPDGLDEAASFDAGGRLVVPGLVDAHTHLAFGGWRADEFERRLRGATYREIAEEGGGIASTVRATRAASASELADRCRGFLSAMARLGVTTVEAKSGYGLRLEDELKQLRVYRSLAGDVDLPRVVPTFLGAHAVPPGWDRPREAYVDAVAEEWVPAVAGEGLARHCDVFVEEGAFTPGEARRVLEAGRAHGLVPKLHADQLSDGGGAELAAALDAASADHLEHVSDAGIRALAEAGVVGVVLPLAGLYLGQASAPARAMADAGVPVAVATDFNPGTAPSYHLPLAMTLACVRGRLTPSEALKGATLLAARAVGEEDRAGSIEPGKRADFAVVDAADPTQWLYHHRPNACVATVGGGKVLWDDPEAGVFGGAAPAPILDRAEPDAGRRGPTAGRGEGPA